MSKNKHKQKPRAGAVANAANNANLATETADSTNKRSVDVTQVAMVILTLGLLLAAYCQTRIAQTTMKTGTRAYLALAKLTIYCPVCDTGKIPAPTQPSPYSNNASISAFFINSGHSPARDIDEAMILYVAPIDKNFKFEEQPDVLEQPKHMMVQGTTDFPLQITRSTNAINIVTARGQVPCGSSIGPPCEEFLYIYGHVSYTDVFNDRHTLLYCAQYQPASTVAPEHWNACAEHNEEYNGERPH
jgi:hypothetical protein